MKYRTITGVLHDLAAKRVKTPDLIASRDHHAISPAQTFTAFTQPAVRKQAAATPRIGRIDRDDVQVARKAEMLETVIQNKTV
jgi:hypothetical protein